MAEYIEREALLAAYDAAHEGAPGRARKLIAEAPVADVAPVVRCWECKHFRENTDRHGGVHMNCIKSNHIPKVEAEHFCSYGERKDGDGK